MKSDQPVTAMPTETKNPKAGPGKKTLDKAARAKRVVTAFGLSASQVARFNETELSRVAELCSESGDLMQGVRVELPKILRDRDARLEKEGKNWKRSHRAKQAAQGEATPEA